VHAVVSEVLSDGASGVGGDELEGSGVRGGGGDDDGIFEGSEIVENLDEIGDGGTFLADGDVDAVELFILVAGFEVFLLIEDGVDGDGGLTGLTITDDQFSLASADGDQTIYGFEAGLHGFVD